MLNLRSIAFFSLLYLVCVIGSFSQGIDKEHNQNTGNDLPYLFKHLIITDTEDKVNNIKSPKDTGAIVVMDVPALRTAGLSQIINKYFGKVITTELFKELNADIKKFITDQGVGPVTVITPAQNIAKGDIRLVVVVGKYTLAKLTLSPLEKTLKPYALTDVKGQIIWDDLPQSLATPELTRSLAPFFAKPITSDSMNSLILTLSSYLTSKNEYLAGIQIPVQNTESGSLWIGLKLGRFPLKKIVIANSETTLANRNTESSSETINTLSLPLYSTPEFKKFINHYIGEPITVNLVTQLEKDLVEYGKKHDRLLVQIANPELDLTKGEIHVVVLIGHYSQLHIKGNRWFSDKLLQERLGISPGDEIKESDLNSAYNWVNQNSFRQVQILLDQVGKPPGVADLDVAVQEVLPVRLSASYSNALNSPLGNSAYSANAQVGNLWGLDHELNYTYSTNNTPKYDQSHSVDYKAPLPWHDVIRVDFAYSLVYPQALFGYVGLNEKAKNTVVDVTYSKSISKGLWTFSGSTGIDYKQVNTNLTFGEYSQPINTYDVGQFIFGASAMRKDPHGSWSLSANLDFSPGGFNSRNTNAIYGYNIATGIPTNQKAQYEYGRMTLERSTVLPLGFQWISRAQMQLSTTNLQGSEQLIAYARGYSENESGDQGIFLNQEFRTPPWRAHLPYLKKNKNWIFSTQIIGFLDYAKVSYKHPRASDINLLPLMGAGVGIRTSVTGHFSVSFDLGWHLLQPPNISDPPMRGSFSGTLAY
jgi:hemolysin activation/secretion protein